MSTRVLIAGLNPMARDGMAHILAEQGVEVIGDNACADVVEEVRRLAPDAVVLDLDRGGSTELGGRVRAACPGAKVVLWARGEDVTEILDPGATAPRFLLGGDPDELRAELVGATQIPPQEDEPCRRT